MSYIGSTPTTQSFISGTDYFNGDGSTITFTLSRQVNSVNDIEVLVANVEQIPSGYSVSGNTLTFSAAPAVGTANIYVRYLSTTNVSLGVPAGTSINGNFSATTLTATSAVTTPLITSAAATPLTIQSGGVTAMTLDTSGNLLVGATSVGYARFETTRADTGNVGVGRFLASAASGYAGEAVQIIANQAGGVGFNLLCCYYAGGAAYAFRVRGDGTIYAQNTTVQSASDLRFKENIVNSVEGLAVVSSLRPVRFDIKEGHGVSAKTNQLGFIAQEVKAVFPDAVDVWGESDDPEAPYLSLGSTALIPVLVKAIQELKAIIDTQTTRITALEAK